MVLVTEEGASTRRLEMNRWKTKELAKRNIQLDEIG